MKKSSLLLFLLTGFCLNSTFLFSKNIKFSFSVDKPERSDGLQLVENQQQKNIFYERNGVKVLAPPPNSDYFQRHGLSFRVIGDRPPNTKDLFLIIEHQDENIGLIEVYYDGHVTNNPKQPLSSPGYAAGSDAVGYTCLGTGRARQAIFRLKNPAFQHRLEGGTDILIAGIASLTKIMLTDQITPKEREKVRAEIPVKLVPKITLKNPMHLVTTAGISLDMNEVDKSLERMHELCPLMKVLGFNGIETYVGWNFAEAMPGRFDWSAYDKIVKKAQEYDLKWFPLLIVGSAYTLPDWYFQPRENVGFKCLEHGASNPIQTIFCENQTPHVKRFLTEFGKHYEPMKALLG
ncbi:beta-galactosidase, partial [candidate division KSB1 bacterium]|nr:beta-galactosidase [candidate division KSB1 bacterium]